VCRYRSPRHKLDTLLTPGFFPGKCGLNVGDVVLLHGQDGMAQAWVRDIRGDPATCILEPFKTPAAPKDPDISLEPRHSRLVSKAA
jgi:hypothetical protein